MMDTKKILASIAGKIQFEPIDDRVLIKPLKPKMVKKTITVPATKPADNLTNVEDEIKENKQEVIEVPANCSLGVVLKLGSTGALNTVVPFSEGDVIVYPTNAGMPFELFKDSRLLKRYEILGLWRG
jgi:co-chaperonin GroES (HSP10)